MRVRIDAKWHLRPLFLATLLIAPAGVSGAATIVSAKATAFQANFQSASGNAAMLTPIGVASASAPPASTDSIAAASVSRRLDAGPVSTGLLYASLGATALTGLAEADIGAARASTAISFTGFGVLVAQTVTRDTDLAGMSAWALGSSTIFDGTDLTGTSRFDELYVNRENHDNVFYSNGMTSFAPNTVAWDRDGYRVVLNEQILSDETIGGGTVRTLTTNAYHATFTAYLGILSGDLIAGQSQVTISTVADVPEPATWAMMIAGFGLIGAALRRPISRGSRAGTSGR